METLAEGCGFQVREGRNNDNYSRNCTERTCFKQLG